MEESSKEEIKRLRNMTDIGVTGKAPFCVVPGAECCGSDCPWNAYVEKRLEIGERVRGHYERASSYEVKYLETTRIICGFCEERRKLLWFGEEQKKKFLSTCSSLKTLSENPSTVQ